MLGGVGNVTIVAEAGRANRPKLGRQQERSSLTQRRLMEATIACLAENGYAGTSMERVVARAGLSRGAQVHHFHSKSLLLQASFKFMLDQLVDDLEKQTQSIRRRKRQASDVFRYLWKTYFSADLFKVTLELIVASRTDHELREALVPVTENFRTQLDRCFRVLCRDDAVSDERVLMAVNLSMALLRGMGAQTVLYDHPAYFRSMLDEWLVLIQHVIEP